MASAATYPLILATCALVVTPYQQACYIMSFLYMSDLMLTLVTDPVSTELKPNNLVLFVSSLVGRTCLITNFSDAVPPLGDRQKTGKSSRDCQEKVERKMGYSS